jgi:hypothetical protein
MCSPVNCSPFQNRNAGTAVEEDPLMGREFGIGGGGIVAPGCAKDESLVILAVDKTVERRSELGRSTPNFKLEKLTFPSLTMELCKVRKPQSPQGCRKQ